MVSSCRDPTSNLQNARRLTLSWARPPPSTRRWITYRIALRMRNHNRLRSTEGCGQTLILTSVSLLEVARRNLKRSQARIKSILWMWEMKRRPSLTWNKSWRRLILVSEPGWKDPWFKANLSIMPLRTGVSSRFPRWSAEDRTGTLF